MAKSIHIVFQVLNFLFSSDSDLYYLSADEEKMLILLARHRGEKGIYPSITTLAKESKRHRSNVMSTLDKLEEHDLIKIVRSPGKSNHYELCSIFSTSSVDTSSAGATRSVDTSSAGATSPVASTQQTSSAHATQYNTDKQSRRNNTERATTSSSPPSIFEPDDESIQLAKELSLNLVDELSKFREIKKKAHQSQYTFRAWLKDGHAYNLRIKGKAKDEPRSTVQFWGVGHPGYDSLHSKHS